MGRQCEVCKDAESKYKCPCCLAPYCSVACYRHHKETPCSKPESPMPSNEELGQPPRAFEEDSEESGLRLRRSQLEAIVASDEIRRMLRDQELQKLIMKIDSATNAEQELDKAMEGPAFQEFTDKVRLRTRPLPSGPASHTYM